MRGVGEATAAITVVNALATGVGAALGVGLRARAEVTLAPAAGGTTELAILPEASRTPLVEATLRAALAEFHPSAKLRAELTLTSEIPPAAGLKSSSAVQSATLLAVARSAGASVAPLDLARLGAEVALRTGASATGAFDDALAGLVSGCVVTDNGRRALVRRLELDPALEVALWIPPRTHPASPSVKDRFRPDDPLARASIDAALAGRWGEAMELNSQLVEAAMGYEYAALRGLAAAHKALGAGVSGLGPAFAAVCPAGAADALLGALPSSGGERRRVSLAAGRSDPGGPM
jgi:shikimate kinase